LNEQQKHLLLMTTFNKQ